MIPIEQVRALVERAFPESRIELSSPMGDDHHFQLLIVSERFAGKSMVQQHQMVYQALGEAMKESIHALSLRTFTPEQWRKAQGG